MALGGVRHHSDTVFAGERAVGQARRRRGTPVHSPGVHRLSSHIRGHGITNPRTGGQRQDSLRSSLRHAYLG
jgi:hypothetical protein